MGDGIMYYVFFLSRRTMLRGTATVIFTLPLAALSLSSCNRGPSPKKILADKLVPLVAAAYAAAKEARLLAATNRKHAKALEQIAAIREEHANLLREEILRLHPTSANAIDEVETSATTRFTPATPAPSPSLPTPSAGRLDALKSVLSADAEAAQKVAVDTNGFQSGLTASVSAAITSLKELLP